MTPDARHAILQAAISTFGGNAQIDMCLEEMSKLAKALLKERRYRGGGDYTRLAGDILEEMADVQIMLDQLRLIYGETDRIEEVKLQRLAALARQHGGMTILDGADMAAL